MPRNPTRHAVRRPDKVRDPSGRLLTVFGLGGTISMTAGDGGGVVPALSTEQLVAAVPGLGDVGVTLDVEDLRRVSGSSLGFADLTALSEAIGRRFDRGADGIVVIQGTDTIEETAYLLDLAHDRPEPVVVTGAMRNPTMAGADGPANLLAAVRTAASPQARDLGVIVVFADEIHAASRVRKAHSTSVAAFRSPDGGPLGHVVEGRPRLLNHPHERTVFPPPSRRRGGVRVGLVTMALGDDGWWLDAATTLDGLVVAGFGAGHVPDHLVDRLAALATRIPVILSSRTGAGPVLTRTYAYPGSESDLLTRGLIPAAFLDPLKSRLLLHHLLTADYDRTAIEAAFTRER